MVSPGKSCPYCGTGLAATAAQCTACGRPLPSTPGAAGGGPAKTMFGYVAPKMPPAAAPQPQAPQPQSPPQPQGGFGGPPPGQPQQAGFGGPPPGQPQGGFGGAPPQPQGGGYGGPPPGQPGQGQGQFGGAAAGGGQFGGAAAGGGYGGAPPQPPQQAQPPGGYGGPPPQQQQPGGYGGPPPQQPGGYGGPPPQGQIQPQMPPQMSPQQQPQGGYGAPPQQMQPQGGYGAPPQQMHGGAQGGFPWAGKAPTSKPGTLFGIPLSSLRNQTLEMTALLTAGGLILFALVLPWMTKPDTVFSWTKGVPKFSFLIWPIIAAVCYLAVALSPKAVKDNIPPVVLKWVPFSIALISIGLIGFDFMTMIAKFRGASLGAEAMLYTWGYPVMCFGLLGRLARPHDQTARIIAAVGAAMLLPSFINFVTDVAFKFGDKAPLPGGVFYIHNILMLLVLLIAVLSIVFVIKPSQVPALAGVDAFAPLVTAIVIAWLPLQAILMMVGFLIHAKAGAGALLMGLHVLINIFAYFGILMLTAPEAYDELMKLFSQHKAGGPGGQPMQPQQQQYGAPQQPVQPGQQQGFPQQQQGYPPQQQGGYPPQGQPPQGGYPPQGGGQQGGPGGGWPQQ